MKKIEKIVLDKEEDQLCADFYALIEKIDTSLTEDCDIMKALFVLQDKLGEVVEVW